MSPAAEDLAKRIRDSLAPRPGIVEKKMFGGRRVVSLACIAD